MFKIIFFLKRFIRREGCCFTSAGVDSLHKLLSSLEKWWKVNGLAKFSFIEISGLLGKYKRLSNLVIHKYCPLNIKFNPISSPGYPYTFPNNHPSYCQLPKVKLTYNINLHITCTVFSFLGFINTTHEYLIPRMWFLPVSNATLYPWGRWGRNICLQNISKITWKQNEKNVSRSAQGFQVKRPIM